jgi:protein PhnA
MDAGTICPQCSSENAYQDGTLWICPECNHEWMAQAGASVSDEVTNEFAVRDANGNLLSDGDTVSVIKDLKLKGSSQVIKGGTKVKGIRLVDGHDGHNISCKIDGIGAMNLKSEFVKKV